MLSLTTCHHATEPPRPTPPDTTSHDFVWKTYYFGEGAPSHFKDVAIVNDTVAFAVGTIYESDSTGQPSTDILNIAVWNGVIWNLDRIVTDFRGSSTIPPIDGIYLISNSLLCLTVGGGVIIGNMDGWTFYDVRALIGFDTLSFVRSWGSTENSMWFVGLDGCITRYVNHIWERVPSGTCVDLQDIDGTADGKNIWTAGRNPDNSQSALLKYDNGRWRTLWHREGTPGVEPFGYNVTSVWRGTSTFVSTSYAVWRLDSDTTQTRISDNLGVFTYRIRGNADNDIVVVGDRGIIWHYNGATWQKVYQGNMYQTFYSCAMKGNLIIAVGTDNSAFLSPALVCVGRRY